MTAKDSLSVLLNRPLYHLRMKKQQRLKQKPRKVPKKIRKKTKRRKGRRVRATKKTKRTQRQVKLDQMSSFASLMCFTMNIQTNGQTVMKLKIRIKNSTRNLSVEKSCPKLKSN
jgi:hypothetical protein